MPTDPKLEKTTQPTRDMLGHAIRGEFDNLAALIQPVGNQTYQGSISTERAQSAKA